MTNPKPSPITDCKLCYPNPCIGGAHRNAMIEDGEIVPNKPITPEEEETVETLAFNLETSTGCIAASGAVKALHDAGYRVAPKPVDYEAEVKKVWPDARAAWSWNACAIILQPIQRFPSFETEREAWQDAYSKLPAPPTIGSEAAFEEWDKAIGCTFAHSGYEGRRAAWNAALAKASQAAPEAKDGPSSD